MTTAVRTPPAGITLNAEQEQAVAALESGRNILLTGTAGVGKSTTLNAWLARTKKRVAVTASTGIAATHIGGMTLHRWSGIGLGDKPAKAITNHPFWWDVNKPVIAETDVLVIDEVSCLDGWTFGLVSAVCGVARTREDEPFGGLQLVLCGDFGQLAPVSRELGGFAFESPVWWAADIETHTLTQVMRTGDPWFVWLLQCVRSGHLPPEAARILTQRVRAYDPLAEGAVRLMTHNRQVDDINASHLRALPGPEWASLAIDEGEPRLIQHLEATCPAPRNLTLRRGARVMLARNLTNTLVNGSLGTVEAVTYDDGTTDDAEQGARAIVAVSVRFDYEGVVFLNRERWDAQAHGRGKGGRPTLHAATRSQFPLRLAWALTIHRAQGSTLDKASINLSRCFAPGQAYVALSRARTIQGLNIETSFNPARALITDPTAAAFCRGEYVYTPRVIAMPKRPEFDS
jgi:ATP-dependent exoDNAse (exonuclease V) alpha subunit